MAIKYEIRTGRSAPCELWSVVETDFGGNAENFVCEGTATYCNRVKDQLEKTK